MPHGSKCVFAHKGLTEYGHNAKLSIATDRHSNKGLKILYHSLKAFLLISSSMIEHSPLSHPFEVWSVVHNGGQGRCGSCWSITKCYLCNTNTGVQRNSVYCDCHWSVAVTMKTVKGGFLLLLNNPFHPLDASSTCFFLSLPWFTGCWFVSLWSDILSGSPCCCD